MSNTTVSTKKTVVLAVAAGFLLLVSNSAFWFSRTIFDTDNFTKIATDSLQSESSRTAIATGIVDKALEKRPAVKEVIDDRAIALIGSLLGTSQVRTVEEKAIRFLQTTITSPDPQPVKLDLSGTKQTITRVVDAVDARTDRPDAEKKLNPDDIPDEIVLFDPSGLPNIYAMGMALLWLGPISLVATLGIFGYLFYTARQQSRQRVKTVLWVLTGTLVVVGLVGLMVGPLFRPPVLAQAPGPNLRIVTGNLYDAFIATFTAKTNLLFVGALLSGGGALWLQLRSPRASKKHSAAVAPTTKSQPVKKTKTKPAGKKRK